MTVPTFSNAAAYWPISSGASPLSGGRNTFVARQPQVGEPPFGLGADLQLVLIWVIAETRLGPQRVGNPRRGRRPDEGLAEFGVMSHGNGATGAASPPAEAQTRRGRQWLRGYWLFAGHALGP